METRFEKIRAKYRDAKRAESKVDLLSLKMQIEAYINDFQAADQKNEELISEAQDMLIDLTKIIEEGHCQPFRPEKL